MGPSRKIHGPFYGQYFLEGTEAFRTIMDTRVGGSLLERETNKQIGSFCMESERCDGDEFRHPLEGVVRRRLHERLKRVMVEIRRRELESPDETWWNSDYEVFQFPANSGALSGQLGIRTRRPIKGPRVVGPFSGVVLSATDEKNEVDERHESLHHRYQFSFRVRDEEEERGDAMCVDPILAEKYGLKLTPLMLINDCRVNPSSAQPTPTNKDLARQTLACVEVTLRNEWRVPLIVQLRDMDEHEEALLDYGDEYWDHRGDEEESESEDDPRPFAHYLQKHGHRVERRRKMFNESIDPLFLGDSTDLENGSDNGSEISDGERGRSCEGEGCERRRRSVRLMGRNRSNRARSPTGRQLRSRSIIATGSRCTPEIRRDKPHRAKVGDIPMEPGRKQLQFRLREWGSENYETEEEDCENECEDEEIEHQFSKNPPVKNSEDRCPNGRTGTENALEPGSETGCGWPGKVNGKRNAEVYTVDSDYETEDGVQGDKRRRTDNSEISKIPRKKPENSNDAMEVINVDSESEDEVITSGPSSPGVESENNNTGKRNQIPKRAETIGKRQDQGLKGAHSVGQRKDSGLDIETPQVGTNVEKKKVLLAHKEAGNSGKNNTENPVPIGSRVEDSDDTQEGTSGVSGRGSSAEKGEKPGNGRIGKPCFSAEVGAPLIMPNPNPGKKVSECRNCQKCGRELTLGSNNKLNDDRVVSGRESRPTPDLIEVIYLDYC